jgi:hypothetical protein
MLFLIFLENNFSNVYIMESHIYSMLKRKEGQLTLFVIVAIVIVAAIILYFLFRGGVFGEERYDSEVKVLRDNLQDCFTESYSSGLNFVGYQGGYINVPEPKETSFAGYFSTDTPYYYYEGELHIPTIEKIESEIESFVVYDVNYCLEEYKNNVSDLAYSDFSVDVVINEEDVVFTNNLILTVYYNEKSVNLDFSKIPIMVPSDLNGMYEMSYFIASSLKEDNEWMPFSDIVEKSQEYNLYVNLDNSDDGYQTSVVISSPNQGYYPSQYIFNNKYSFEDLEEIAHLL